MPHLSKHRLDKPVRNKLEKQFISALLDTSTKKRASIFGEIMTPTEHLMIAKRLAIILGIQNSVPTHKLARVLKVSPSTIARYEVGLENGKYRETSHFLKNHISSDLVRLVVDLIKIPFEVGHRRHVK